MNINSIVMWVILQNNAGWDCFKTPILQEILRIQNLRHVGRYPFLEVKINNARQLIGIFCIEPNDEEFKFTIKAARRKLEVPMPAAMPCKIPIKSSDETYRNIGKRQTRFACVVDADESTRPRVQGAVHKSHQDHVTAIGMNSMTHYSLVHKFIPMLQAFKILDAEAAVEKEWEKLENIPAWQLTRVRNKKDVIDEARNKGRKVHVASLMDLCHLKNSELEPKFHMGKHAKLKEKQKWSNEKFHL